MLYLKNVYVIVIIVTGTLSPCWISVSNSGPHYSNYCLHCVLTIIQYCHIISQCCCLIYSVFSCLFQAQAFLEDGFLLYIRMSHSSISSCLIPTSFKSLSQWIRPTCFSSFTFSKRNRCNAVKMQYSNWVILNTFWNVFI